ncbi:MAG: hypothetical protein IPJ41_16635 [Phycisphaerales bacterium]|nr:hypothetical protein [Phycisphaerales bacterium]
MPRPLAAISVLLMLLLGACSREAPPAPSPSGGPRIAVLSPALAVTLCDLGLRDRIVGRHGWDMTLDPAIPVCGEQNAINYEALVRVAPTHVLTEWGARELPGRLRDLAEAHHWTTHDFRLLTLADIDSSITTLESLFPDAAASPRAERLHRLATEDPPPPRWSGRVLLLMGTSPIAALGPGSAHHELLLRVGGRPALETGSPYMTLIAEDVLRLAPDAIILIQSGDAGTLRPESDAEVGALMGATLARLDIPAVRTRRLAVVRDPLALLPSTALAEIADRLEGAIEGWASE